MSLRYGSILWDFSMRYEHGGMGMGCCRWTLDGGHIDVLRSYAYTISARGRDCMP